jgi:RES domain-containing protein
LIGDGRLRKLLAQKSLELTTCAGHFIHVAQYRFASTLLSAAGARYAPGRFHVQNGAPALYFAESPVTALLEVGALYGGPDDFVVNKRRPLIMLSVELTIPGGILDMTDPQNLDRFATANQELTGSWLLDERPATQRIGAAAYAGGRVIAIRYPSARWRGQELQPNLVVFRDRLVAAPGCKMIAYDRDSDLPATVEKIQTSGRG